VCLGAACDRKSGAQAPQNLVLVGHDKGSLSWDETAGIERGNRRCGDRRGHRPEPASGSPYSSTVFSENRWRDLPSAEGFVMPAFGRGCLRDIHRPKRERKRRPGRARKAVWSLVARCPPVPVRGIDVEDRVIVVTRRLMVQLLLLHGGVELLGSLHASRAALRIVRPPALLQRPRQQLGTGRGDPQHGRPDCVGSCAVVSSGDEVGADAVGVRSRDRNEGRLLTEGWGFPELQRCNECVSVGASPHEPGSFIGRPCDLSGCAPSADPLVSFCPRRLPSCQVRRRRQR